jgi:hypothetical protein
MPATALFRQLLAGDREVLLINPAGPSSLLLTRAELTQLAQGEIPTVLTLASQPPVVTRRTTSMQFGPLPTPISESVQAGIRQVLAHHPAVECAFLLGMTMQREPLAPTLALVLSVSEPEAAALLRTLHEQITPLLIGGPQLHLHAFPPAFPHHTLAERFPPLYERRRMAE